MSSCLGNKISLVATLFLFAWNAQAAQLEIIHTNDLHSSIEHSYDQMRGSYAAVKATIDRLKAQAGANGIDTLTLDAGDFTEGTPFHIVGDGTESIRLIDEMGYDAIAIGNHDWLTGAVQMNQIFASVAPTIPFLSANFKPDARFTALTHYIQPSKQFERSGIKIGVLGLSTDDIVYRWALEDGKIGNPIDAAKSELKKLRKENDLVIALTHLGVDADQKLASEVDGIDIIVGGHSHTELPIPLWQKAPHGENVPIFQAGSHGEYVGDLLVDYEPGQPLKILHYNLIPVYVTDPQDAAIAAEVSSARQELETIYGQQYLNDVLTVSDVPMEVPYDHPTVWGNLYIDSLREAANVDCALDSTEFFGGDMPAGNITRESLMDFYPRYFDLTKPMGWTVWKIDVPGWLLKIVLEITTKDGLFFNLSQIDFDVITGQGKPKVKNITIAGQSLHLFKTYHVAVSEGVGRGLGGINKLLTWVFHPKDTGIPIWQAVENHIANMNQSHLALKNVTAHRLPASVKWKPARTDALIQ